MIFKKKTIIIALLLLSLFMISAVSAATNNAKDTVNSDVTGGKLSHTDSTHTYSNSKSMMEKSTTGNSLKKTKEIKKEKANTNKNDNLKTTTKTSKLKVNTTNKDLLKNQYSKADNDKSLKMDNTPEVSVEVEDFNALNDAINSDTSDYIELKKDYHGSYDGGRGIQINRENIIIDGKGHTINSTGENSRIFNILVGGITLKNTIFAGGSSGCGGAIYTNKNLTIINCTFKDNQATGSENGGGAICADNVKMSIYNCTFINNHASFNGGAIAAVGSAPDDYEIFNCTFIDNTASNWGGAFYSNAEQDMGDIVNSTFINNKAKAGDAVYTIGYEGTIDRCIFVNNTANSMICGPWAEMLVNNSIIVNNYGDSLINVETPTYDNNWWGTTVDDGDSPVVNGDTLTNYYVLDMAVDDDSVDISLNNLYDNGELRTSYDKYALPSINFTVNAKNVEVVDAVVLGPDGKVTIEHAPSNKYEITIEYNGVELTRDVKPSFKWLNDKINDEGREVSLDQDCIYDPAKDSILTNGIEFAKDMTIDGQGHIIDAKESTNIFYFDDDTNSYSLTLKNIIFANATGINGAAVYFKGNKIEIINCTFINNNASSEGDAVYIDNALNNTNRITQSIFTENTGSNSILYLNLDSNAKLGLDNSIFINNSATKNIVGSSNVIVEYNWWANTIENYNVDISKTDSVTVKNWLFLKIDTDAAITGDAILSLNNVYNCADGKISTYSEYALKPITFDLGGLNSTSSVPTITLNDDGRSNYQFRMDRINAKLTASYGDVTTNKKLEYTINDDGSFRALNEIIFFSEDGAVIELTHDYVYSDSDNITEGIVIPRKITINGNGHTIDAKSKTRIFMIPENVSHITINNISFINAKASHGSVIILNHGSDYTMLSYCNFTNNVATYYGGVIDCVGDYCTIENCNFINNRAVSRAGVIRYYHDNQAYIKNSNFINNRVSDGSNGGGVIYVDAGAVDIDKSVFINNVANDRSGSVLFTGKPLTMKNSVFLNNTGLDIIHGNSKVELINNWFGNNATNYETINGNITGITVDNWLFLNATVNPNSIQVGNSSTIVFKLYSYNQTANKVQDYDNFKFTPIDLTIAPTNGGVNKDTAHLEDQIKYTATNVGEGSVTASISNVRYTIKLTNNPADTEITVNNPTITLNAKDTGNIIATLNPREAGRLSYTSNDTSVVTVDNNGKITAHKKGYAKITISFTGNTNYNAATDKTIQVTVKQKEITTQITGLTIPTKLFEGKETTITGTLTANNAGFANQKIIINITNTKGYKETYTGKTNSAGKFSIKINPKVNGPVAILTTYTGNSNYKSITISQTRQITVTKGTAKLTLTPNKASIKAGEKVTFTVKLTDANTKTALTDTITIQVNGKSIKANVKNGKATVTYTVPRGTDAQTITATTAYSSKYYNKATATSKFKLTKTTPTIKKTSITCKNKKTTIKATIKDATNKLLNKNVEVTVKVDGRTVLKNKVVKNGKISLSFKKALKKGKHKIIIASKATKAFNKASFTTVLKV